MVFRFAVCSYSLAKESNLVLQCQVTVWLSIGSMFEVWGTGSANQVDVLLKVLYPLVTAYISV